MGFLLFRSFLWVPAARPVIVFQIRSLVHAVSCGVFNAPIINTNWQFTISYGMFFNAPTDSSSCKTVWLMRIELTLQQKIFWTHIALSPIILIVFIFSSVSEHSMLNLKYRYEFVEPCLSDPSTDFRALSLWSIDRLLKCLSDPSTDFSNVSLIHRPTSEPCLSDPSTDFSNVSLIHRPTSEPCLSDPSTDFSNVSLIHRPTSQMSLWSIDRLLKCLSDPSTDFSNVSLIHRPTSQMSLWSIDRLLKCLSDPSTDFSNVFRKHCEHKLLRLVQMKACEFSCLLHLLVCLYWSVKKQKQCLLGPSLMSSCSLFCADRKLAMAAVSGNGCIFTRRTVFWWLKMSTRSVGLVTLSKLDDVGVGL